MRLDLTRIRAAVSRIAPEFQNTPHYACEPLGAALGCDVVLKVETLNPIGCFKGRGTETLMARLAEADGPKAAICASAGNLGQALAYSGRARGLPVTVVADAKSNPLKLSRIKALGANLKLVDGDIELARETAREIAVTDGAYLLEDSLDLDSCEGAATIGLELVQGAGPLDAVLIALGAGAMATGIGHVFKCLAPHVEVIAIQPQGAPAMTLSWRAREVVETDSFETIADGVAGRCPIPEVLGDLLETADDAVLVSEDSIKEGMRLLFEHAALVVEPSAALGHRDPAGEPRALRRQTDRDGYLRRQRDAGRFQEMGSVRPRLLTQGCQEPMTKVKALTRRNG